jgi:hypothetical protein
MRAGYGKNLRNYLSLNTQPKILLDLGGDMFDTATVDTNILIFEKGKSKEKIKVCDLSKMSDKNIDLKNITETQSFVMDTPKPDKLWTLMNNSTANLKEKIERIGTPLSNWGLNIKFGIKTGFNEAFIIDTETKTKILNNCQSNEERQRTEEIIKPVLRGRDINKYSYNWYDLWLVSTFPSLQINIDNYQSLKKYLQSFCKKINQTGEIYIDVNGVKQKSRKKTGNKWFETQDQIAYYKEFDKEKIIFPRIVKSPMFMYDTKGYYGEATSNIITGENLKYLTAFLNSSIVYKIFNMFYEGGGISGEIKLNRLEMIPIPQITQENKHIAEKLESIVDEILEVKAMSEEDFKKIYTDKIEVLASVVVPGEKVTLMSDKRMALFKKDYQNIDFYIAKLENQIDEIVYKLYDLTGEEIAIIEDK